MQGKVFKFTRGLDKVVEYDFINMQH